MISSASIFSAQLGPASSDRLNYLKRVMVQLRRRPAQREEGPHFNLPPTQCHKQEADKHTPAQMFSDDLSHVGLVIPLWEAFSFFRVL